MPYMVVWGNNGAPCGRSGGRMVPHVILSLGVEGAPLLCWVALKSARYVVVVVICVCFNTITVVLSTVESESVATSFNLKKSPQMMYFAQSNK